MYHGEVEVTIDASGDFSVDVPIGEYDVRFEASNGGWYSIGSIVVNSGDTSNITLGELIELSRDTGFDADASAEWATRSYVDSAVACGRDPGILPVTDLGYGTLGDGQILRRSGSALAALDAEIDSIPPTGYTASYQIRIDDAGTGWAEFPWRALDSASPVTAVDGGKYILSGGETLNLPSSPATGDYVVVIPHDDWVSDPPTVDPGAENIESTADTIDLDDYATVVFTYLDATIGWTVR